MKNGRLAFSSRVLGWLLAALFGLSVAGPSSATEYNYYDCFEKVRASYDAYVPAAGWTKSIVDGPRKGSVDGSCQLTMRLTNSAGGYTDQVYSKFASACPTATTHAGKTAEWHASTESVPDICFKGCMVKWDGVPTSFDRTDLTGFVVTGAVRSWRYSGLACPTPEAGPEDSPPCIMNGGAESCVEGPNVCITLASSGQKICRPAPKASPGDCALGSDTALCDQPLAPPNPPIPHVPEYNPNPPPPNITINYGGDHYDYYISNGGGGAPPPGEGGGDPPNSGLCGTAGNPPCPPPTSCGQPGKPPCGTGESPPDEQGEGCGKSGQPKCDPGDPPQPSCGVPGKPACTDDGTPSCGVQGKPPCADDGGPTCGVIGKPQCEGDGSGPSCGVPGKPECAGGNTGSCGAVGQPPCASCGGQGQPSCSGNCGTPGQPPCNGSCGGSGQPECHTAAGGGDCETPPSCSGEQILCLQVYQAWKTRCGVETLSDLIRKNDYDPTNDDAGIPDEADSSGFFVSSATAIGSILSADGWLGGGACPTFGSVNVLDTTISLDSMYWCQVLDWLRVFLQASAVMASLRVLMR